MKRLIPILVLATAVPALAQDAAQHQHPAPEKLGKVHFETSCKPEVRASFDRAVALLHSFSFSTAKKGFEDVLAADPACAVAHWGVAMTHWGNPFGGIKTGPLLANGAAAAARGLAATNVTPRERGYIAAVAELYKDHATAAHRDRTLAYERAMEQLQAAHPNDTEAAAFYALAVSQTALPTDKTFGNQLKAAALLERLFAADPDHPGLAHYIIHAFDHPPLAARALQAARRYATIAPSAPHALHMPSHTFTRVGSWQESIETNIASAASAMRDGTFAEALHAMDYQAYAYLQTGQDAAARRVMEDAPKILAKLDVNVMGGAAPPVAGFYAAAAIAARYALERGAWAEAAALQVRPTPFAQVDSITHFARAIGAARSGKPAAAAADIAALRAAADKIGSADPYWAGQVRIQLGAAEAWVAFAEGRQKEAVAALRATADAEDATDKSAISPGPIAPAREQLAEMLLETKQPAAALVEFEAVMKKEPNRYRATAQAAKAAELAGDAAKAKTYRAQLAEITKAGDKPGRR
jgi:Tfp pilus assembly protein PilF